MKLRDKNFKKKLQQGKKLMTKSESQKGQMSYSTLENEDFLGIKEDPETENSHKNRKSFKKKVSFFFRTFLTEKK